MTNSSKTKVWSGEYYPYGELYSETISTSNNHRLPGQYDDRTAKPYYNWNRYYSTKIGRYYQADPIGLNGGINMYGYAAGNPLSYTDPYGLDWYENLSGDLSWFDSEVPFLDYAGKNVGKFQYDILGYIIDPVLHPIILNQTESYETMGKSILNTKTDQWPSSIVDQWSPGCPGDIKSKSPFHAGEYSRVYGEAYLAEDLGNLLFGTYAMGTNYPFWLMMLGGGVVQTKTDLSNSKKINWEYWNLNTLLDDPRGSSFVKRGGSQYQNWIKEGKLPR